MFAVSTAYPLGLSIRQEGGGRPKKGAMKERPVRVNPDAIRIRPTTCPPDLDADAD